LNRSSAYFKKFYMEIPGYDSTKGTLVADMPELPIRYLPLVTHELLLQRTVLKRMTIRNVLYHLRPHPHPLPSTCSLISPPWRFSTCVETKDSPQTEQSRRGFLVAGLGICSSGGSIFLLISGHILQESNVSDPLCLTRIPDHHLYPSSISDLGYKYSSKIL